jgi:ribosome-associated protein
LGINKTLANDIDVTSEKNTSPTLSTTTLATSILQSCVDSKGIDLTVLDVSEAFGLSDFFIVVSGRSDRHVQGMINRVINSLEEKGITPIGIEGFETGHWIILDYGEVVLHAFYEPVRETYDIEGLWSTAPRLEVQRSNTSGDVELRAA